MHMHNANKTIPQNDELLAGPAGGREDPGATPLVRGSVSKKKGEWSLV